MPTQNQNAAHMHTQGKGKRAISSLMVNAPATELTQLPSGLRVASEVRASVGGCWRGGGVCVRLLATLIHTSLQTHVQNNLRHRTGRR